MRMRQSIAEIYDAVFLFINAHGDRRERLLWLAALRPRRRRAVKTQRQGSMRFAIVLLTLLATAIIVAIAMFQTLYYVMG